MNRNLDAKLTGALHAAVRKVLKHHKLTKVGDGVVEADLIYAMADVLEANGAILEPAAATSKVAKRKTLVDGFESKSPCGRVYFVPIAAVRTDYATFLSQQDGISMDRAYAKADENKDFLETWFCEQFNWDDMSKVGTLIKQPTEKEVVTALDFLRGYAGGGPSSDYKRVERAPAVSLCVAELAEAP